MLAPAHTDRSPRTETALRAALVASVLALGALLVWRPLDANQDFWAHAAVGRWMWQNGRVADRSLFLWTASEPWVYHHWLTELGSFGLTHLGGPDTFPVVVLALTALLALTPFPLALWLWSRHGPLPYWSAVPVVLALQALAIRFQPRPELLTELLLAILLIFLTGWSSRTVPDRTARLTRCDVAGLTAVMLLFALWANLHGGVVLGILALGVTAACDLVQDRFDRRSRALAVAALLAPLAACINPYGLRYWQALRAAAGSGFAQILEWTPVWSGPSLPGEMLLGVGVVVPLALAAWRRNPERRWAQLGWLLLMGGLFLRARRNVWPLLVTSFIVLAANARALDIGSLWDALNRRQEQGAQARRVPAALRWLVGLGLLIWVALLCADVASNLRLWRPLTPAVLERGIVAFVRDRRPAGRIFNDYENSAYLQWRFAGDPPLYLDLLNAYPDQVIADYQDIVDVTPRGRGLLQEQQIGVVLLTTHRPPPSLARLAKGLDADKKSWARVYAGDDGAIWVRRTPANRDLVAACAASTLQTDFATLEHFHQGDPLTPSRDDAGSAR